MVAFGSESGGLERLQSKLWSILIVSMKQTSQADFDWNGQRMDRDVYKIEKTDLGFQLTFAGAMTKCEVDKWYAESEQILKGPQASFGVVIDMRTLALLPVDAQGVMVRGQAMYRSRGMERSCVILDDAITKIQFMRLAKKSGIFKYERYIDASAHKNWLAEARNWVSHAIAPAQ
jgi:hypothetical protein